MPNIGKKWDRSIQWILTLVLACFPPLANYLLNFAKESQVPKFIDAISPHGELLIVSVALVGEAIGNLFGRQINKNIRNITFTFCIGFVLIATYLFANISNSIILPNDTYNPILTSQLSFKVFLGSIFLCIWCQWIGKA